MRKNNFFNKILKFEKKHKKCIDGELCDYLNVAYLPNYLKNDEAHNLSHIYSVLLKSFRFAKATKEDINYNVVFVLACLHDAMYYIDFHNHEILIAETFKQDKNFERFFTKEEEKIIFDALKFHDSFQNKNLNIYAKILRTADCDSDLKTIMKRLYYFRRKYFPQMSYDEIVDDSYNYFVELFGRDGLNFNKHCLYEKNFERVKKQAKKLIDDRHLFIKVFKKFNL